MDTWKKDKKKRTNEWSNEKWEERKDSEKVQRKKERNSFSGVGVKPVGNQLFEEKSKIFKNVS